MQLVDYKLVFLQGLGAVLVKKISELNILPGLHHGLTFDHIDPMGGLLRAKRTVQSFNFLLERFLGRLLLNYRFDSFLLRKSCLNFFYKIVFDWVLLLIIILDALGVHRDQAIHCGYREGLG